MKHYLFALVFLLSSCSDGSTKFKAAAENACGTNLIKGHPPIERVQKFASLRKDWYSETGTFKLSSEEIKSLEENLTANSTYTKSTKGNVKKFSRKTIKIDRCTATCSIRNGSNVVLYSLHCS